MTMCNRENGKWEVTGAVQAPHAPPCGVKPADMGSNYICDSNNKKWTPLVVSDAPEPDFASCAG